MSNRDRSPARLSPGGYLGLQLISGVLVLSGASWVFGSIADEVLEQDAFAAVDSYLTQWFNGLSTPRMTGIMQGISDIHDVRGMSVLLLITSLGLVWKRYWTWLLVLLLAVPGGAGLNVLMKQVFERARPQMESSVRLVHDYSFPSGHACASTLFYGVLAAFMVSRLRSWRYRALVGVIALFMIALVAFGRLYLGAHFFSDVLAGIAEGVAWLALCLTAIFAYVRRRRLQM